MAVVAIWGPYVWSVKRGSINTFHNYARKTAYKTEPVEDGRNKPGTHRAAPELTSVTFSVLLARDLGISPEKQITILRDACEAGEPYALIIGNKPQSQNRFLLKSVSEKNAVFGPLAQMHVVLADLELEEYRIEMAKPDASTESSGGGGGGGGGTTEEKETEPAGNEDETPEEPVHVPPVYTGAGGGGNYNQER